MVFDIRRFNVTEHMQLEGICFLLTNLEVRDFNIVSNLFFALDDADSGAVELVDWTYQMISPQHLQIETIAQFLYLKWNVRRVILGYFKDIKSETAQVSKNSKP